MKKRVYYYGTERYTTVGKGYRWSSFAFTPLAIVGIILGAVNGGSIKKYLAAGGAHTGKVKAASIVSKVALIAGIVMAIFWILYFALIGAAVGMASLQ